MNLADLNPILVQPKRLAALSVIVNSDAVEFAFLREHLELGDSDLSKQMSALVAAEYVAVKKTGKGRNRKTRYRSTRRGDTALRVHAAALTALVSATIPDGEPASPQPPPP